MTYDSTVLALSPAAYWKTDETTGSTLADSSGNSRPLTTFGSPGPTLAQTGPGGNADAISWTNVSGQTAATQSYTTNAGTFTHVIWFYLTANPSGNLGIQTRALDYATTGAADGEFYISSDGKPHFRVYSGGDQIINGSSAVALNTWHLAVASVGAAGMKLRIDKVTVASNAGITSAYTGATQKIIIRGGGTNFTNISPVKTAKPAYFTTQLSDANADAIYDAMGSGSASANVNAVAATATAAAVVPSVSASSTVAPPAATASASTPPPVISAAGNSTVSAPAASATAAALPPTVAADASVLAALAAASAAALAPSVGATADAAVVAVPATATATAIIPTVDNGSGSITVFAVPASATAAVLAPVVVQIIEVGTDTSNVIDGLDMVCVGRTSVTTPVAAPPAGLAERYDVAIPYPVPVVNGGRVE